MKIAIATEDRNKNSMVNSHFGKSPYFAIYSIDDDTLNFVENAFAGEEKAGCMAVDMLKEQQVSVVVAGRFGAKATDKFRSAGITLVIPDHKTTVNEIINQLKR